MAKSCQVPPVLLARASGLLLSGRIHFPKNRIGEIVQEEEEFRIFRQVVVDPGSDQPESPEAIFKVCYNKLQGDCK